MGRVERRVLREVLDDDGLAPRDDLAGQALAQLDSRPDHEGRGRLRPGADDEVVALEEAQARRLGLHEPGRLVDDQREHLVGVVDRGELARDVVEDLESVTVPLRLLVEARVAEEEPDLLADVVEHPELALLEAPARRPPDDVEAPGHPVFNEERQDKAGLVAKTPEHLVAEAGVARDVVRPDRAAIGPHRGVEPLLAERERRAGCGKTLRALAGLSQCKKTTTCHYAARASVRAQFEQLTEQGKFRWAGRSATGGGVHVYRRAAGQASARVRARAA